MRAVRSPSAPKPLEAQQPQRQEKEEQRVRSDAGREQEQRAGTNANAGREPEQNNRQQDWERPVIARDAEKESAKSREQKGPVRASTPPVRQPPTQVYSFLLLPVGPVREGGDVNKIDLPANAGVANLQLPLIEDTTHLSYQATLSTQDGRSLQTWTGLKPTTAESGKIVSIRVPAALLRQGKYQVKLSGVTAAGDVREISTYSFQVAK
jgi:hypothetical protein